MLTFVKWYPRKIDDFNLFLTTILILIQSELPVFSFMVSAFCVLFKGLHDFFSLFWDMTNDWIITLFF